MPKRSKNSQLKKFIGSKCPQKLYDLGSIHRYFFKHEKRWYFKIHYFRHISNNQYENQNFSLNRPFIQTHMFQSFFRLVHLNLLLKLTPQHWSHAGLSRPLTRDDLSRPFDRANTLWPLAHTFQPRPCTQDDHFLTFSLGWPVSTFDSH